MLIFFFNDTATTEIYTNSHTLSLHDALPLFLDLLPHAEQVAAGDMADFMGQHTDDLGRPFGPDQQAGIDENPLPAGHEGVQHTVIEDRKSTRLNSSH